MRYSLTLSSMLCFRLSVDSLPLVKFCFVGCGFFGLECVLFVGGREGGSVVCLIWFGLVWFCPEQD